MHPRTCRTCKPIDPIARQKSDAGLIRMCVGQARFPVARSRGVTLRLAARDVSEIDTTSEPLLMQTDGNDASLLGIGRPAVRWASGLRRHGYEQPSATGEPKPRTVLG